MEGESGRRVGVAVDFSACSRKALEWAADNVVRDGDHLILVTVRPEGNYEDGEMQLWGATGSRTSLSSLSFLFSFFEKFKGNDFFIFIFKFSGKKKLKLFGYES